MTRLTADDVFYFGNAIGETGDSANDALVDFVDRIAVELGQDAGLVAVDNPFDFNRDGVVDVTDVAIVESNLSSPTGDLDKDDRVALTDLAQLQTRLGAVGVTDPFEDDLTGEGDIDRRDAAAFVRIFGATPTVDMLARRLALILPSAAPSPSSDQNTATPQSPSAVINHAAIIAAVNDAVSTSVSPQRNRRIRVPRPRLEGAAADLVFSSPEIGRDSRQRIDTIRARRRNSSDRIARREERPAERVGSTSRQVGQPLRNFLSTWTLLAVG